VRAITSRWSPSPDRSTVPRNFVLPTESPKSAAQPIPLVGLGRRPSPAPEKLPLELDSLRAQFHNPIWIAAGELGCGITVLKRTCRRFNVARWPYRKFLSLQGLLDSVEGEVDRLSRLSGGAQTASELSVVVEEIKELMDSLRIDPNQDIDASFVRLRQSLYKHKFNAKRAEAEAIHILEERLSVGQAPRGAARADSILSRAIRRHRSSQAPATGSGAGDCVSSAGGTEQTGTGHIRMEGRDKVQKKDPGAKKKTAGSKGIKASVPNMVKEEASAAVSQPPQDLLRDLLQAAISPVWRTDRNGVPSPRAAERMVSRFGASLTPLASARLRPPPVAPIGTLRPSAVVTGAAADVYARAALPYNHGPDNTAATAVGRGPNDLSCFGAAPTPGGIFPTLLTPLDNSGTPSGRAAAGVLPRTAAPGLVLLSSSSPRPTPR